MAKVSKAAKSSNAAGRRRAMSGRGENTKVFIDSYRGAITQAQLDATLARVKKMTQAELVESLKACGVLTPSGKLAKQYRS